MKKTMPHDKDHPLPATAPADLLWIALKFAGALGIALALATWVNRLLAQI